MIYLKKPIKIIPSASYKHFLVKGVPIVKKGYIYSINPKASYINLWNDLPPQVIIDLENKAMDIQKNMFHLNKIQGDDDIPEENLDILEETLTEVYDSLLYILCTNDVELDNYPGPEIDWLKDIDGEELIYLGLIMNEELFRYTLHLDVLSTKLGDERMFKLPLKLWESSLKVR